MQNWINCYNFNILKAQKISFKALKCFKFILRFNMSAECRDYYEKFRNINSTDLFYMHRITLDWMAGKKLLNWCKIFFFFNNSTGKHCHMSISACLVPICASALVSAFYFGFI